MYCTLLEAYNVPSFDPPSRKKKCAPDAQARTSAVPYEPYRRDGGNGLGDFTMYKYATPKGIAEQEPIQGTKPLQRRIPYESFENYGGQQTDSMVRTTYAGMEGDRKQMCKMYGICSADQMETFISGSPVNEPSTPIDTKQADKSERAGLNTKAGAGSPSLVGTNNSKCDSAPDFYEVPLSEETKRQFNQAMNTALNQGTASTAMPEPKLRYDEMKNVTGYYDEDLEQYLKNSDANKIPKRFPMNPDAKPQDVLYNPNTSPLQKTIKRFSEHSIQAPLKPENLTGYMNPLYDYELKMKGTAAFGWDLAMFILAGILIIVLIDQLFKMGVMLGMRHTMELLSPYMTELKALSK